MAQKTSSEQVEKLAKLIKDIQFAMLTTAMPDGSLRSRPMATQRAPFDGTLWFFTPADSAKVHEIEDDQHVNVSYADPSRNNYVSVSGRASVVRDEAKAKALWSESLRTWFPKGSDDPDIALLKVTVDAAEYWDAPSSAMVHLYGYAKAVTTGKRPRGGENEKVKVR
jgi:general stress protein 26